MKELLAKIKKGLGYISFIVLAIIAILKGKEYYENNKSNDTPESITDDITERRVTEFRDRTGDAIRRIFNNRGTRRSPEDSGRGNTTNSTGGKDGIDSTLQPGDTETRTTEPDNESSLNSFGICIDRNNNLSVDPLDTFDPDFLKYIEGPLLKNKGSKLLCLLAPLQLVSRRLTVEELILIYRQGIKDPSIMDRNCKFGNKADILTYHAMQILNSKLYLKKVETSPSDRFPLHHYDIIGWGNNHYTLNSCTQEEIFDPSLGTLEKGAIVTRTLYRVVV